MRPERRLSLAAFALSVACAASAEPVAGIRLADAHGRRHGSPGERAGGAKTPIDVAVPADFVLEIRRGPCEGRCPVYSARLAASGALAWLGESAVAAPGPQHRSVPPATVAAAVERLERERVLELTSPPPRCLDTPTVQLDVTLRGAHHTLRHESCWERDTPEGRRRGALVRDLERLLGLAAWVGGEPG